MNELLELAYLGGAIDADGFISMTKKVVRGSTTYSEVIGLAQLSPLVPRLLQSLFGGYIQERKRKGANAANWRPLYYWAATTKNAANAVAVLRPYLRIKTEQADAILALRESKTLPRESRRNVRVGLRSWALNPETQATRERLYLRVKALNHNGVA